MYACIHHDAVFKCVATGVCIIYKTIYIKSALATYNA